MSVKWKKVLVEVLKYAFGAVLGALGASGCAVVPFFNFG